MYFLKRKINVIHNHFTPENKMISQLKYSFCLIFFWDMFQQQPADSEMNILFLIVVSQRINCFLETVMHKQKFCLMLDVWCLMFDVWCLMFDAWCLMLDAWYLMFDAWGTPGFLNPRQVQQILQRLQVGGVQRFQMRISYQWQRGCSNQTDCPGRLPDVTSVGFPPAVSSISIPSVLLYYPENDST